MKLKKKELYYMQNKLSLSMKKNITIKYFNKIQKIMTQKLNKMKKISNNKIYK